MTDQTPVPPEPEVSEVQPTPIPQEPALMLDVHPPHHAASTWRDFFIHMATIVLGLLIAIGLEQSLEALHHRRQRIELMEAMHREAEHNLPILQANLQQGGIFQVFTRDSLTAIKNAKPEQGIVTVTLPSSQRTPAGGTVSRTVWNVAKTNGKVALLPDEIANVYDRLDYEAQQSETALAPYLNFSADITAQEYRLGQKFAPGVTLQLSVADRDELVHLLVNCLATNITLNYWTANWAGAADAVLHDARSTDEIETYIHRYQASLPKL